MNDRVALFDFCETIVNFQTADAFVFYVYEKIHSRKMHIKDIIRRYLIKFRIIRLLNRVSNHEYSIHKKIVLWQLKGIDYATLNKCAKEYYDNRIKPNFINGTIRELQKLKSMGFYTVVVSGGYDIYLKYFIDEYKIDKLISTELDYKNNICKGTWKGHDCLRQEKVRRLNKIFNPKPQYSISFSDSFSDLPMLNWTNEAVVVSKHKSKSWANKYNFKEFIWE